MESTAPIIIGRVSGPKYTYVSNENSDSVVRDMERSVIFKIRDTQFYRKVKEKTKTKDLIEKKTFRVDT